MSLFRDWSKQDIVLLAPATITMTARLTSASETPWCAYYNVETAEWEADGLVVESASVHMADASDGSRSEVEVSCTSYHLSDFAVSTTQSDGVFTPIELVRRLNELFS